MYRLSISYNSTFRCCCCLREGHSSIPLPDYLQPYVIYKASRFFRFPRIPIRLRYLAPVFATPSVFPSIFSRLLLVYASISLFLTSFLFAILQLVFFLLQTPFFISFISFSSTCPFHISSYFSDFIVCLKIFYSSVSLCDLFSCRVFFICFSLVFFILLLLQQTEFDLFETQRLLFLISRYISVYVTCR